LIKALNEDVPYNQLIMEHIAGDLLEKPRYNKDRTLKESPIGTAQYRMVPHGFGVTDAYDELITFTDNQIDVLSKATMGLTVSCARCHNHKFDPISQKDFYRLFGIMISNHASQIVINSEDSLHAHKKELHHLKQTIKSQLAEFWLKDSTQLPERLEQLPTYSELLKIKEPKPHEEAYFNLYKNIQSHYSYSHPLYAYLNLIDKQKESFNKEAQKQKVQLKGIKAHNENSRKKAYMKWDLTTKEGLKSWFKDGNGSFDSKTPQVSPNGSFSLFSNGEQIIQGIYPKGVYSHLLSDKHYLHLSSKNFIINKKNIYFNIAGDHKSGARYSVRNYPLTHGGLHPTIGGARQTKWGQKNLSWTSIPKFPYWKGDQAHIEISTAGDATFTQTPTKHSWVGVSEIIISDTPLKNEGASIYDLNTQSINEKNLASTYREVSHQAILDWKNNSMNHQQAFFLSVMVQNNLISNQLSQLPSSIKSLIHSYRDLENKVIQPKRTPGLREAQVVNAPLLVRGNYKKEASPVPRQFLELFDNQSYSSSNSGRLELAKDIVSEKNPLTARLLINRLWAICFGRGIVSTTDNFGRLGKKPTHPKLLDHLTLKFMKNNWSIKDAIKNMVLSRTFMSTSHIEPEQFQKDPDNLFLSYYNSRRLSAENIRDTLHALGQTKERKSIFLPVIRNRLNPFLTTFDAPIPISTVSRRLITNVPAQSLTMMNGLNPKIPHDIHNKIRTYKDDSKKIEKLFLLLYSRPITQAEAIICEKMASEKGISFLINSLLKTKEVIFVR